MEVEIYEAKMLRRKSNLKNKITPPSCDWRNKPEKPKKIKRKIRPGFINTKVTFPGRGQGLRDTNPPAQSGLLLSGKS